MSSPEEILPHDCFGLHNPKLSKSLEYILVHSAQPLLLKVLLPATRLNRSLQMFADKFDQVEAVHGVRVNEFSLASVFRGFGVVWIVGTYIAGPVE